MNTNLLNIIKQITAEQGDSILSEPKRVSAFFSDIAQDIPKVQKTVFIKCLEQRAAQILKDAPEAERADLEKKLAQELNREDGYDLLICEEALRLLSTVLFGEEQKKSFCKNCGKELQEEWKSCPYCATAVESSAAVVSHHEEPVLDIDWGGDEVISSSGDVGYGVQLIEPANTQDNTNEKLEETNKESGGREEQLKKKLKTMKRGLIAAIIIGFSVIVGMVIWMTEVTSSLQSRNFILQWERDEYRARAEGFFSITELRIGNERQNSTWITEPGSSLTSSEMRFLVPVMTYNSGFSGDVTFFIKIIEPNGQVFRNPETSPVGFTYSRTVRINSGSNQSLRVEGWGAADFSAYLSGAWTVEVWHNNARLALQRVWIN